MPEPKKGLTFTHASFLAAGAHNRTTRAQMKITSVRKGLVYYTYADDPSNKGAWYLPRDEWVEKYGD